jgi:hypothetical protein
MPTWATMAGTCPPTPAAAATTVRCWGGLPWLMDGRLLSSADAYGWSPQWCVLAALPVGAARNSTIAWAMLHWRGNSMAR